MKSIVVATKNRGKLVEIQERLNGLGYEITSLLDHDADLSIVEDATTFEGNALKKARAVVQNLGLPALADDSGLEVEALGDRPGIHSARYGGPGLDDSGRNELLLRELKDVPVEKRRCRFRAALVYMESLDKPPNTFFGTLEGLVAFEQSGSHGFGYDPIFVPNGYDTSLATLGPEVKTLISHRARALEKLVSFLSAPDR
jgi:XTP/dITP diphosphohydrolase